MILVAASCARAQQTSRPASQNPSPMVETTRAHDRIGGAAPQGRTVQIRDVLPAPVPLFIHEALTRSGPTDILVHFHGAAEVPMEAVDRSGARIALLVVHLGSGSAAYERPLAGSEAFERLLRAAADSIGTELGRVYLSAFSAGYGAVRAVLSDTSVANRIDGVLLLDGLHTSYIPERTPLAAGGRLDTTLLEPFLRFARLAAAGERSFVYTHSEVFPGTFASTTETADYLIEKLGLERTPVLEWGPVGMQQLSEAVKSGFTVLGFAGNSAPDHVDHLHGMSEFLSLLIRPSPIRMNRPRTEVD